MKSLILFDYSILDQLCNARDDQAGTERLGDLSFKNTRDDF